MGRYNADISQYIREIRCSIPQNKQGKQLLKHVKENVMGYVRNFPDADYQSITERFGTSQQIVSSFFQELDAKEINRALKMRKRVISIILVSAALILLSWAGLVCSAMAEHINNEGGFVVEELVDGSTIPNEEGE